MLKAYLPLLLHGSNQSVYPKIHLVFILACLLWISEAQLDSNDIISWITKSVCFDENGSILSLDPYYKCPDDRIRKYKSGDVLPYHTIDQYLQQISDSFSLLDSNGNDLYIHNFNYEPIHF